jgi:Protein of unknown function (DUF3179)
MAYAGLVRFGVAVADDCGWPDGRSSRASVRQCDGTACRCRLRASSRSSTSGLPRALRGHGRQLHFLPVAGGFRDRETGSRWSLLGHADAGPLAGQNLTPVVHEDTFWFVWAAFRPHTQVVS